ncbi:methanethiol oxidase [Parasteatoda tepidariorum]|uniref:methanethiol oxidase n=1 Tax=Parasteatoda tepidariorum TaxID=114398 RepID=UPI0039BD135F
MASPVRQIGYNSPLEAFKSAEREKLAYVTCVSAKWQTTNIPDFIATVDLDPESSTFSKIIHRTALPNIGDELHHSGWNACSSCKMCSVRRSYLIAPGINSDRIYIIDVETDPRAPRIHKVVDTEEFHEKGKAGGPHTVHCLPSGDVMISCLGDETGEAKGTFVLLEQGTFKVKGTWQDENDSVEFNYDYWYQPRHNVMVSTEWAAPNVFRNGFFLEDVQKGHYGHSINIWDWTTRKRIQRMDLGAEGLIPLEVRFLHNPDSAIGFVGCALSSTVFKFHKHSDGSWKSQLVARTPNKKVANWILPEMPGLITDILISMDDHYLYVSNWLHGDIRQYDISDTENIKLTGQVFLGGSICKGEKVIVVEDAELKVQPERPHIKGIPVRGGPQMLQLSLDGKRLYVTNSLFSAWDKQFYPEIIEQGSMMLMINVDTEKGGLQLDQNFLVDFSKEGNILAHEIRFPGGDCTSDIWD